MELSPEQFASLRRVLSEPAAKAAALVALSTEQIERLLGKVEKVVRRCAPSFGDDRLLLRHVPGKEGGRELNDKLIRELISKRNRIVAIGDDGTMLAFAEGTVSLADAASESEEGPSVCVLCSAVNIGVFAAGKVIAEIGLGSVAIETRGHWRRSWRELRRCMDDHFTSRIENQRGLVYWAERKGRLLLAGRNGTEKLFHHDLFWWCQEFVVDALDVYGEAQGMGQDKTDITIVTEVGNIVIEVKWLGRNENNTCYLQVRIEEGLIQVADYLNRDDKLMQGYVVLYDGRPEAEHANDCGYPSECRHAKCEEPVIYFLRSETPSERASRLATGSGA